jgi:2-oxoglutarate ferredoxin oxidoreductase subunit gamma
MITRTIFSGFGGQGVLLMGYVLSHGYGAEMRGGTANCTVTLSDKKVASPVASNPDILVAMNFPSLEKFGSTVIDQGLVFLNSSLIEEISTRTDVELVQVPALELAKEVGSERTANMVMIGVVCAKAGLLTAEETITGMRAALKGREKLFKINEKGIERGFAFAANGK